MNPFHYDGVDLYCEQVPLAEIAAKNGTPCYVYSSRTLIENYHAYDDALAGMPHKICYAVKANSSLGVLSLLASAGSGFDIVSGGELYRVLKAGGDPAGVVFSGVGKTADEIESALAHGIHGFNCESEPELAVIDALAARRGIQAHAAVRVNPDVATQTHPYISTGMRHHKFGIDIAAAEAAYERGKQLRNLVMDGVSCHIGSQLLDTAPMLEAVDKLLELVERLRARGIAIGSLDLGGGLGVAYRPDEQTPEISSFVSQVRRKVEGKGLFLRMEPGRSIVGEAGALVTRVLYRKCNISKQFIIVDAGMNDLIRPALYHSHHEVLPVRNSGHPIVHADVVGPICETGDFLARDREIAEGLPGDLLAVCTAGAYGFAIASNYNSRLRPPEILVCGSQWKVIRTRETYEDLLRGECSVQFQDTEL
jgi:diaminopimelate decarboxylase